MTSRKKKILGWSGVGLLLVTLAVTLWVRRFHTYTPAAVLRDLRAAAQVKDAPRPVERFLEARYGSLAEPAHRQQALVDFFDIGHIEGLYVIVGSLSAAQKQSNITAMAQWIASYRQGMSEEEKQALRARLCSEEGRASVQQATREYLQKDVHFRAATAPVIQELMTTLATLQQP